MNTSNPIQSVLLMTTSLKGGGGKSTLANAFVDYARRMQLPMAAYDADGAIGSLSHMHASRDARGNLVSPQDPLCGVVDYNIRDDTRSMLFNSVDKGHTLIMHDMAGGSLMDVQRVLDDHDGLTNFFRGMNATGTLPVFLHLVTPDASTVASVKRHLDLTEELGALAQEARHIAVLNRHGNRKDRDFPDWFGYVDGEGVTWGGKTRARLFDMGGAEMDLPSLNDRTMALVKDLRVPFSDAVDNKRLDANDRLRVRIFVQDFEKALTPQVRHLTGISQ
ncbi:hypothetical protein [Roseovarius nanhaiticus]|uniref:hypothetical protein n=1 Tax=Roseovarius nanhaiticus TaxID=573024 RepID=UPI0024939875|nr:hypothetical protein [Roseovarius nanhaiticus]